MLWRRVNGEDWSLLKPPVSAHGRGTSPRTKLRGIRDARRFLGYPTPYPIPRTKSFFRVYIQTIGKRPRKQSRTFCMIKVNTTSSTGWSGQIKACIGCGAKDNMSKGFPKKWLARQSK